MSADRRKQRGFTIALIGPDGAGKTTLAKRLQVSLPFPIRYLYMGVSIESSNVTLPTTRLIAYLKGKLGLHRVPPHVDPATLADGGRRRGGWLRAPLRLVNRSLEEWYRQLVAWTYTNRGTVVLFDRHFLFEYEADATIEGEAFFDRLHRWCIDVLYPRPDLVICLDAPAEVLYARCHEYSVRYLAQRRASFLRQRDRVENFVTVNATEPTEVVERKVLKEILAFADGRWHREAS